ncbi:hypothetical protein GCM10010358_65940 [Streptomyces minutiscleroticus]|uniref:Secreted protein n=1 Tax=Streptomyces minutiscleroticus TaxID=68238 RepID=A0A918NWK2_9ACTN|nr:hypothetical protein [Streptomyces minutiscleroticus]GGY03009.1 hypothetical protein GCM10010358_65940 [Streptomyces minutiscleroticus]
MTSIVKIMLLVNSFASMAFSGLSALVIESVEAECDGIVVRARTSGLPVGCPDRVRSTAQVHGCHVRRPAEVPVDARSVVIEVRIRRLACASMVCPGGRFVSRCPVSSSVTSAAPHG